MMIREMSTFDRPREKVLNNGVESLSNVELVALLLRSGNKNESVIELSKKVLEQIEKLNELKDFSIKQLTKIPGIKVAKATTLLAAIELGKRLEIVSSKDIQIQTSYDIYRLMKFLNKEEQEHFYCIYLDTKMMVIKKELIYIGTVDQISIHPRDVFKKAIRCNASYIILVHNHPSGNATPSNADIKTTKILKEAAKIIYMEILDHIIIGNNQFYSFNEKIINKL